MLGAPAPGDNIHEQFHRLLLSERTFVQDVTAFYRRVVRRLTMEADYDRRVASSTDPASSSDAARVRVPSAAVAHRHHVRRCFDNVARLVFVHDAFLDDLERTLSRIGHGHNLADALIDCFAANLPGLTFHAEYAADLPIAIGVLSWRASRDSPLQRFIGDASPDGRPEYLFEQLRLPLARVPQYLQVMLVVRDLKPKRVAFVDVIVQALTTTLAAVIDPAPFPAAAANEIMEVEDQLKDPIDLVRPGRTLGTRRSRCKDASLNVGLLQFDLESCTTDDDRASGPGGRRSCTCATTSCSWRPVAGSSSASWMCSRSPT